MSSGRVVLLAAAMAVTPCALRAQRVLDLRAAVHFAATADSALPPKDAFIGLDKPKHFFLSAFVEAFSFNAFQLAGAGRKSSVLLATGTTAAVGIGREVHDRKTKNLFSFGDLLWDAIGGTAAGLMLRHTYR